MRVHIVGASGSGTTTLGRAVAARLGSTHLDTDDFFWLPSDPPFETIRVRAERQALLGDALARHPGWVLSGSLCGWGDVFIPRFDLVVFLWLAPDVRLARLVERERARYGDAAVVPGGPLRAKSEAFLAWAARYDAGGTEERSRAMHEQWLATLPCPVLRLETPASVDAHVARVMQRLEPAAPRPPLRAPSGS
jgi:adenylate kinase family enzyme